MSARPLAGREVAAALRATTAEAAARVGAVRLAVVTATGDESAAWYVRSLVAAAPKVGIGCDITDLGAAGSAAEIAATLRALSADAAVHGIILQTPLPAGLRLAEAAADITPAKDVDGANPLSLGRLAAGLPAFAPATAQAVLQLLDFYGVELAGRRAVVVGRSVVVGKPLAQLLLARDATVTVCHSRTTDLAAVSREADVLVAAAGRAGLITARHVRPGAVVVDVGTNPTADGGLAGDVDIGSVGAVAGALSPVPGGVGPVTTAQLLFNTASAAIAVTAATRGSSTAGPAGSTG
ncbi:MAG: bifunctional 5,10-methylenetetrahydrofolate dehydrogenase/5,10-methenyltetrahydrofolate cyclohydrolase [Streptosporangiaceae bacterium]